MTGTDDQMAKALANVTQVCEFAGIDPAELAARLADLPTGVAGDHGTDRELPRDATLHELVAYADRVLSGGTHHKYVSSLRFLANGWHVRPEHLADAVAAARAAEMRPLPSADPTDHTTVLDDRGRPWLVLWPGYGDRQARTVLGAELALALKVKRADTYARKARRDRDRAGRKLPPLAWDGDGAVEGLITAASWMYAQLRANDALRASLKPLERIAIPERDDPTRREMEDTELAEILEVLLVHGADPELYRRVMKFHLWTAHRRIAAFNLTLAGLDFEEQSIEAVTKYGRVHKVPAPLSLLEDLQGFAFDRGSTRPEDPVLRTKNRAKNHDGLARLNAGTYADMADLVRKHLTWARDDDWTVYWCRHHAKARIEAIGGVSVAIRLLGHREKSAIERYGKASFGRTAWAVSVMTNTPMHPAADPPPDWNGDRR